MFGTTAEAIKLKPVITRCINSGGEVELWCSAQQYAELTHLSDAVALTKSTTTRWLAKGFRRRSITRKLHVLPWALVAASRFILLSVVRRSRPRLVLVHGDTLTTALGAILARLIGTRVGHIEAGLRSGDWRNPFPEEICRRLVGRLAHFHFAPSEIAAQNLVHTRGTIIHTNGNTVVDTLGGEFAQHDDSNHFVSTVVLLHRVELLSNHLILEETVQVIADHSRSHSVLLVVDALAQTHMTRILNAIIGTDCMLQITPKLPHSEFVNYLRNCQLVVTDSGGLQEEAAALGKPCILHRVVSERDDGLGSGGNAVLTGLDPDELRRHMDSPPSNSPVRASPESPSDVVVRALANWGFLPRE